MDLFIANSAEDVQTLCRHIDAKNDVMGLALWPDAQFAFEDMGIRYATPNDLIGPAEHELLATEVTTLSKNWWRRLFPDIEEPAIDGLKITTLYEYEVEQAFSRILFNVYSVIKGLEKLTPKRCLFALSDTVNRTSMPTDALVNPQSLLSRLEDYPWEGIFIDQLCNHENKAIVLSFDHIEPSMKNNYGHQKNIFKSKLRALFSILLSRRLPDFSFFIRRKLLGINDQSHNWNAEFVVSGGGRCLGALIDLLRKKHNINHLPHKLFGVKEIKFHGSNECRTLSHANEVLNKSEFLDCGSDEFAIGGFSYFKIVKEMADFIIKQFAYLKQHYEYLQKKICYSKPHAYITISSTGAVDRLNIWASYKSGVRTIWVGDGLGQPNKKISKVVNSAFWLDSPAEKWLVSENIKDYLRENGGADNELKITGYLDNNFQGKPKPLSSSAKRALRKMLGIPAGSKIVMYASSICSKLGMRLISEETYFEIFQAIKDISETFAGDQNILTIIKLHPGVRDRELFKRAVSHVENIKIIEIVPIHLLIDISDVVVVYHSSVGLEALYRGKHLIVYNQTDRPSYLTEIVPGLNREPSKGVAVRLVRDKEKLYSTVMDLLNSSIEQDESENKFSPGLSYYLANADSKFNAAKTAYMSLMNGRSL